MGLRLNIVCVNVNGDASDLDLNSPKAELRLYGSSPAIFQFRDMVFEQLWITVWITGRELN